MASVQAPADWLDACAPGLAAAAAAQLRTEGSVPAGRDSWRRHFLRTLEELSAAVRLGDPGVFARHVQWLRAASAARRVDFRDLERALRCLKDAARVELPEPLREVAEPVIDCGLRQLDAELPDWRTPLLDAGESAGRLALRYLCALLEGDRERATQEVLEAVQGRQITVRDAYLRVLAPALREVGRMWLGDEVSVAEEHFATVVTQNVLARLAPLAPRRPRREHTMVAAAVEGCAHDLATRMIADFFEFDGWRAIPLGADVPAADVTAAAEGFGASVVAISASLAPQWRAVEETVSLLRSRPEARRMILLGGGVVRGRENALLPAGVDAVCDDPEHAVELANAWLVR
jgi:methanogenic corrinoid protein MtbC1